MPLGGETSPFCFVAAYFNLIIIFNIVYHKFLVVSNPRYFMKSDKFSPPNVA
jgi:hypothetical protein